MRLKKIIWGLLLLILISPAYATSGEQSEMTISLRDDGSANVKLVSINPQNFDELKSIINDPKVVSIYQGQISQIFKEVSNLRLYTKDRTMIVEFKCKIANLQEEVWKIEKTDFNGILNTMSILKINLPESTNMLNTNPVSSEIQDGQLVWNNVDFIPHVEYVKMIQENKNIEEKPNNKNHTSKYLLIALIFVIAATLIVKKRSS